MELPLHVVLIFVLFLGDACNAFLFSSLHFGLPGAPIINQNDKRAIRGSFIVYFSPAIIGKPQVITTMSTVEAVCNKTAGMKMSHTFQMPGKGAVAFSVVGTPGRMVRRIRRMPGVMFIEANTKVRASQQSPTCIRQNNVASWALDRIDQRGLPLSSTYTFEGNNEEITAGAGATIYVLDSGIDINQRDFGGRARLGATFCEEPCNRRGDSFGHGTAVAGIAVSSTYGVAKAANVVSVQVLNDVGDGTVADVMAGLFWVVKQHSSATPPNGLQRQISIATMSFGGPLSLSMNTAVGDAKDAGVAIVVAAGNEEANACFTSPSSAPSGITVAATNIDDEFASFSNRGTCIDILAPGVNILSLNISDTQSVLLSVGSWTGTSFATPFVAGAIARHWVLNQQLTIEEIKDWLEESATKEVVGRRPFATCDRLLYLDCQGDIINASPSSLNNGDSNDNLPSNPGTESREEASRISENSQDSNSESEATTSQRDGASQIITTEGDNTADKATIRRLPSRGQQTTAARTRSRLLQILKIFTDAFLRNKER